MLSSCSMLLNAVMVPFAPDSTVDVIMTNKGAEFKFSTETSKKYKNESNDWTQPYAYYVWRSSKNPYEDFDLIARIYNPWAVGRYTNYEGGETYTKDFTLPKDDINVSVLTCNGVFYDKAALTNKYFYRTSTVTLKYEETDSSDGGTDRIHSLTSETTGWAQIGNETAVGDRE